MKDAFLYALPKTLPVLTGYLFLSLSYAVYGLSAGLPAWLIILMSVVVYAGAMQFASVGLLTAGFDPLGAALLTLMVNARHIFYAITLLGPYSQMDHKRHYTIFALTDETFSIVVSEAPPAHIDRGWVYFWVSLLHHFYWVAGTVLGLVVGSVLTINTQGIDFVLTALFATIFTDQWLEAQDHQPAIVGLVISIACLAILGPDRFMIPAMLLIIGFFSLEYRRHKEVSND